MNLAVPLTLFLVFHPKGAEFRVNSTTTGGQSKPAVAVDAAGNFVVAWQSDVSAGEDGAGIYARIYSPLVPSGAEFHVNTYTTGAQTRPSVAMDPTSNFVVAWESESEDAGTVGVFARLYDAEATPFGGEFRVNSVTSGNQGAPSASADPSGSFVVAFEGEDGSNVGAFARRFLSNGAPLGTDFQVNVGTTNEQTLPVVAADASGAFVVAWSSKTVTGGGYDVYARRWAPSGSSRGGEFRVNTITTGKQFDPSISSNPAGGFVVAWSTRGTYPQASAISARAYRADGQAQTDEIRVNTYATALVRPAALSLPDGGFLVVYSAYSELAKSSADILLRQFDAAGSPVGGELRLNTYTTGIHRNPRIVGHANGFIVVWESSDQDGDGSGIYAQKFSTRPIPGDVNGDGIVDISDVFYLINFLFAGGPAPVG